MPTTLAASAVPPPAGLTCTAVPWPAGSGCARIMAAHVELERRVLAGHQPGVTGYPQHPPAQADQEVEKKIRCRYCPVTRRSNRDNALAAPPRRSRPGCRSARGQPSYAHLRGKREILRAPGQMDRCSRRAGRSSRQRGDLSRTGRGARQASGHPRRRGANGPENGAFRPGAIPPSASQAGVMMRGVVGRIWAWLRGRSALVLLVLTVSGLAAGGVARLAGDGRGR